MSHEEQNKHVYGEKVNELLKNNTRRKNQYYGWKSTKNRK